jgi:hypothetical protein
LSGAITVDKYEKRDASEDRSRFKLGAFGLRVRIDTHYRELSRTKIANFFTAAARRSKGIERTSSTARLLLNPAEFTGTIDLCLALFDRLGECAVE